MAESTIKKPNIYVNQINRLYVFSNSMRTNLMFRAEYADGEFLQLVLTQNNIRFTKLDSSGTETTLATYTKDS